ncbi:DUF3987 domain-containing protein [Amycolatopsis sp. NPDC051045]|uniref:DUF3987 domain-containing protein n=1 Tax=Amycolatopsis sp. NPDC051045 TaxID=3156922 RepID=UPI003442827E
MTRTHPPAGLSDLDVPATPSAFEAKAAAAVARARAWLPAVDDAVFGCYLGDLVGQLAPTSEADPIAIYASLLAFAGVHLGQSPHVRAGDDPHPLLVWPLIIGDTATGKKGTSWSAAKRVIADADADFAAANIKGGLTSGEGLAQRFALDKDGEAPEDLRLLALEPEWGGVMAKMRREGNSLSAILRQAWEGGDLSTLTVNARIAPQSHVAILAHITPEEFRSKLSDADMAGGTYNRFLPLAVAWSTALPDTTGADPGLVCSLAADLADRLATGAALGALELADDARELWRDLYLEFNTGDHHAKVAQFVSRALPYTKRVAGIHAALDGTPVIQPGHLTAAAALIRYAIDTACTLFTSTAAPAKLAAWIADAGEAGRTRKDITTGFYGGNTDRADIDAVLTQLIDAGTITRSSRRPDSGKGRSIEVYTARGHPTKETN